MYGYHGYLLSLSSSTAEINGDKIPRKNVEHVSCFRAATSGQSVATDTESSSHLIFAVDKKADNHEATEEFDRITLTSWR